MNQEFYRVQLAIRGQRTSVRNKEELINIIRKNLGNPIIMDTEHIYLTNEDFYQVIDSISQQFERAQSNGCEPSMFVIRRVNETK